MLKDVFRCGKNDNYNNYGACSAGKRTHAQLTINLIENISYWNMCAIIQKKIVHLHFQNEYINSNIIMII